MATIPAVAPPPQPPRLGYEPGTAFADVLITLDDTLGSGNVITFGQADAARVAWRITGELPGWDSPDLAEGAQARTLADGLWDADNYYAGRQITVEGIIDAPDRASREAAEAQLSAATPARGRLVTLTVGETVPKQITCRRSGRLLMAPQTDTVTTFSVTLLAVDPRKYAVDESSAAASLGAPGVGVAFPLVMPVTFPASEQGGAFFTAANGGTYDTPPLIRIVGPGRDLGLANLTTGASLSYAFDLLDGDELIIDTDAGAAQLNGTAYRPPAPGSTVTGRFLLPPGVSEMQFLGSRTVTDVTPLLTMTWRSAWI